jgi:hypothetical protein
MQVGIEVNDDDHFKATWETNQSHDQIEEVDDRVEQHGLKRRILLCLQSLAAASKALCRYPNLPLNFTMQKGDFSSHQNIGKFIEY